MTDSQDTCGIFTHYAQNPDDDFDDYFEKNRTLKSRSEEHKNKNPKWDSTIINNRASYIISKDVEKARILIKISLFDLDNSMTTGGCDGDNVMLTAAQYVVKDSVDEIMNLTEHNIS